MKSTGYSDSPPSEATTVLREATPADYPAIAALVPTRDELFLVHPSGKHPFSVDQIHSLARVRSDLTVAVRNDRVAGFANLYDVVPGRRAFIGNVVVDAAFRGEGVGRRLIEHMIALGFDRYNVAEMAISVFSHNVPALLLYGRLGFRPYAVEERRAPQGGRCALIHMALPQAEDTRLPQAQKNCPFT